MPHRLVAFAVAELAIPFGRIAAGASAIAQR